MGIADGAGPPVHLLEYLDHVSDILHAPKSTDAILQCPPSSRSLLISQPELLVKLAHSVIYSYPFDQVPLCWRRLFTDASIYHVVCILSIHVSSSTSESNRSTGSPSKSLQGRKRKLCNKAEVDSQHGGAPEDGEEDWVQQAVTFLDMAVIVAGAPDREDMIEQILARLEFWLEEHDQSMSSGSAKKGRIVGNHTLSPQNGNIPSIRKQVPMRSNVSMPNFEKHLETGLPLVIQDALVHWPALQERPWQSLEYLLQKTLGGRRLVPVEIGEKYTDDGWSQKILTFKRFHDEYLTNPRPEKGKVGYLAQHDLLRQIPSLRADICIPDYCYLKPPMLAPATPLGAKAPQPELDEPLLNVWIGPGGTVSPLHTDPYHNLLCQVVGQKYVRLYSPYETEKLYPKVVEKDEIDMSNTSQVDVEADSKVNERDFPHFKDADYMETILNEGDILYIPVGWWHYVRSLTVSMSVSFWWN